MKLIVPYPKTTVWDWKSLIIKSKGREGVSNVL